MVKFVMARSPFLEVLEDFALLHLIEKKIRKKVFFRCEAWFWNFLKEVALTKWKKGFWPYLGQIGSNRLENAFFYIMVFLIFLGSKLDFWSFSTPKSIFRRGQKNRFLKKFNPIQNRISHFVALDERFPFLQSKVILDEVSRRYGQNIDFEVILRPKIVI